MALSTLDQTTYTWDLTHQKLDRLGRGDVGMPGWERFKDVQPRKHIPLKVQEVIIELTVKQARKPITALKQELKALDVDYDPYYGDLLKKLLKQAIQDDEDEMLMLMEMF